MRTLNQFHGIKCWWRGSGGGGLFTKIWELRHTQWVMYVQRNTEARSRNHCCRGRKITITYSRFVSVALVIQHAIRMRRITLPSVVCLAVLYIFFPNYFIKDAIFGNMLLNIKCVFWFCLQLLSETFLILRRNERDMIKTSHWLMWSTRYSCQIYMKIWYPRQIFEKYSNIEC